MTDKEPNNNSPIEHIKHQLSGSILEEIHIAVACHQMHTGKPATNIYLGHSEMKRLLAWFEKIRYVKSASSEDAIKGISRAEFMGIPVFEVNAEQHCFAA